MATTAATTPKPSVFTSQPLHLAGTIEYIVAGGRDKFGLLAQAFAGIKTVVFVGWGSQGPAQAQNFRDSVEGLGIKVIVGLRKGSDSFEKAAKAGFRVENGTAGEMYQVIPRGNLVIALTSDASLAAEIENIQAAMKSGACLAFSHGFIIGYMNMAGIKLRKDIDVVGMCPKGMGDSVRRLYEQGRKHNGAGINASYAVEQDYTGNATNIVQGWAVAVGSPYLFPTTLTMEYRSDIYGERGILLGAPWGISEALYANLAGSGVAHEDAFAQTAMNITGPISKAISEGGLLKVAAELAEKSGDVRRFYKTLRATYKAALPILERIYREVASGREIGRVIDDTKALAEHGWTKVEGSEMWRTGEKARQRNIENPIDPTTAGVYLGVMLAQVDVLHKNGHCWSEICNESIIECVDSLNPYMDKRGVQHMVDNCSTTARLGARTWGPQFAQMVSGDVLPNIEAESSMDTQEWFESHPVHGALAECMKFRPPVSIAVQ